MVWNVTSCDEKFEHLIKLRISQIPCNFDVIWFTDEEMNVENTHKRINFNYLQV